MIGCTSRTIVRSTRVSRRRNYRFRAQAEGRAALIRLGDRGDRGGVDERDSRALRVEHPLIGDGQAARECTLWGYPFGEEARRGGPALFVIRGEGRRLPHRGREGHRRGNIVDRLGGGALVIRIRRGCGFVSGHLGEGHCDLPLLQVGVVLEHREGGVRVPGVDGNVEAAVRERRDPVTADPAVLDHSGLGELLGGESLDREPEQSGNMHNSIVGAGEHGTVGMRANAQPPRRGPILIYTL